VGGPGGATGVGAGLAFVSAVGFAAMTVVSRKHRGASTVSAICLAQLTLAVIFAPFADASGLNLAQVGWLALLGIGQIGLGSVFFMAAARSVPAAEMALIFLLEIILGPLWTWIGVSERPSAATLIGGAIVIAAVVLQIVSSSTDGSRSSEASSLSPGPGPV
jgi:drug/metabolite transporter (DMT)-like permease